MGATLVLYVMRGHQEHGPGQNAEFLVVLLRLFAESGMEPLELVAVPPESHEAGHLVDTVLHESGRKAIDGPYELLAVVFRLAGETT